MYNTKYIILNTSHIVGVHYIIHGQIHDLTAKKKL